MKNTFQNLKKPNTILCIIAILLFIVQIAGMFIPCFTITPVPTRKDPNPMPKEYNLMDYCWFECEELTEAFEKQIKGYYVNDYVTGLVLVTFFGLVSLIFILWELKNTFTNYNAPGAQAVKLFSNIFCVLWAAQSIWGFYTANIMAYCNNNTVWLLEMIVGCALAVVLVIRAVIAFINRTRYVVAK